MKERPSLIKKKKQVEELKKLIPKYKTIVVLDLRGLPDKLFQKIRKNIKEKFNAYVKVARLAVINRVLKAAGIDKKIERQAALIFLNDSPYELNKYLMKETMKLPAKPGQIAPFDIIVKEQMTDLPPGPALSELKMAGIKVQIQKGKIAVTKDSVVVKKGEEVTDQKAKALQKLNVFPFETRANVIFGYDGEYIYTPEVLNITTDEIKEGLLNSMTQGNNVSLNAGYPTPTNINILLTEALRQAQNVGINAGIYSDATIEHLLVLAIKQGMILNKK